MIVPMSTDAFEILGASDSAGAILFTCEHASNAIPGDVEICDADQRVLDQHWGWDIGAKDVVLQLLSRLGGQAVVANFSRLWIDPNRNPDASSLIVTEVEGHVLQFNQSADARERERRSQVYFAAYHDAVQRTAALRSEPFEILSVHSFTPTYRGQERAMEVGVLFDEHDESAEYLHQCLRSEGFKSALNAPYSGKPPASLIYSAKRHGQVLGVKYLELEIRQDLIDSSDKAQEVADRIARALKAYLAAPA